MKQARIKPGTTPTNADFRATLDALMRERIQIPSTGMLRTPANLWHMRHAVADAKLLFVAEGSVNYTINDIAIRLERGTMLYRPAMSTASWVAGSGGENQLLFCELRCHTWQAPSQPLWTVVADHELERRAMERVRWAFLDPDETAIFEAEAELKSILTRFLRRAMVLRPAGTAPRGRSRAAGERAVRTSLALLSEHYAEADILTNLHERVRMSEDHFRRIFRKSTGLSPQEYLIRVRLESARAYLEKSNLTVKEVASAVGYHDALYFSRLYRKTFGCPPSDVRKSQETG